MNLHTALSALQALVGVTIVLSAMLIMMTGMDRRTRLRVRAPMIGLVAWGAWFAIVPIEREHDSVAAIALSLLVAYVLVRHGRQVRGIVDGELWWPRKPALPLCTSAERPRRSIAWWLKLNPWWLFVGNADDGYWGDDTWRAGRPRTLLLAIQWWARNPFHNFMFYGIGVSDRHRVVEGPWVPHVQRPGGGWLWCITWVTLLDRFALALPFVSYESSRVKVYAGWRPSGAFGFKFNIKRGAK